MLLSEAIDITETMIEKMPYYYQREALRTVLEALSCECDVEEWDKTMLENGYCQHCSGNGCGMCRGTGEPKRKKRVDY